MSRKWALDLGTTNSALAVWNDERAEPQMVGLTEISSSILLTETPIVPSAVFLSHGRDWQSQLGRWPLLERHWLLGRQGYVGALAREMNASGYSSNYVESFKPMLAREGTRVMTRAAGHAFTAREVTRIFLRELFRAVHEQHHQTIRELTLSVPVDAFETYRAELQQICTRVGIRKLQLLDEPVAAALGYGLNTEREMNLLVFDFGGGTLDLALVRTSGPGKAGTPAEVLAKQGLALGGNNVDVWLVEHFAKLCRLDVNLWRGTEWYQALLDAAQTLKESLYAQSTASLMLSDRMMVELGLRGRERPTLTRQSLVDLLTECGLYRDLKRVLDQLLTEMAAKGIGDADIDEVLVVGGSTLLPEVHTLLEETFGRSRLRDWLPFEAVAYGACVFASGHRVQDFIRHDYALLTFDRGTHAAQYPVIIPRGTVYPTAAPVWEDYVSPTCARSEPATEFELRIYEMSRANGPQREIGYDDQNRLRVLDRSNHNEPIIVCLNDSDPVLGKLVPAYTPDRTDARLHLAFGVNGDRYLIATIRDLQTGQKLMQDQPVIKLR